LATAADVPTKYDLVIGSEGYVLADQWTGGDTSNAPQKAIHAFSPAFIQRTNTQGNYGDDQQDFWLTFSQKDWSLGEDQRYARTGEESGTRRYWRGTKIDVSTPGEAKSRYDVQALTNAAAVRFGVAGRYLLGVTTLYNYNPTTDALESLGAHGLGAAPEGGTYDGEDLYFSTTAAGTVGVRKWDGAAFTTWSANGADRLAYLNNSLYGLVLDEAGPNCELVRWTTGGVRSTLHSFQTSDGAEWDNSEGQIVPFGGKLLILLGNNATTIPFGLYIYDGVGVSSLHYFPGNFHAWDLCVAGGTVFVSGAFRRYTSAGNHHNLPAIYYYSNGQVGKLWEAYTDISPASFDPPALCPVGEGLFFTDDTTATLCYYNPATGGISRIGAIQDLTGNPSMSVSNLGVVLLTGRGEDLVDVYPDNLKASTATVTSSLIDFDSSLQKIFRGIKVDFDDAGGTSTVDIAYRVGDVDGSYTTLQSDAVSGTEYNLSNITGRSISVKVTLNKGNSTLGPVLKRVYVRAVPLGNNFHRARYVLASHGKNGESPVKLRNGDLEARSGQEIAMDLMEAAESQVPLTITDKFETFTGIVEQCELTEFRDREYVAQVTVRQI
jgi:hypothetical protein